MRCAAGIMGKSGDWDIFSCFESNRRCISLDRFSLFLFNTATAFARCQLGGIGRRARLKIEFYGVWVRVPQLVLKNV